MNHRNTEYIPGHIFITNWQIQFHLQRKKNMTCFRGCYYVADRHHDSDNIDACCSDLNSMGPYCEQSFQHMHQTRDGGPYFTPQDTFPAHARQLLLCSVLFELTLNNLRHKHVCTVHVPCVNVCLCLSVCLSACVLHVLHWNHWQLPFHQLTVSETVVSPGSAGFVRLARTQELLQLSWFMWGMA